MGDPIRTFYIFKVLIGGNDYRLRAHGRMPAEQKSLVFVKELRRDLALVRKSQKRFASRRYLRCVFSESFRLFK